MNSDPEKQRDEGEAILELAGLLRQGGTPISPHVPDSPAGPFHRSFVVEAVREGYLLHYGEPRLLTGHDEDLALLAGDYLYALGIERLASRGDTDAVLELAELIGECARRHAEGREDEVPGLWREAVAAIGDESAPNQ